MIMKWIPLDISLESNPAKEQIYHLAQQVSIHPVLVHQLLFHGLDSEDKLWSFLYPSPKQFHGPFLFNDMKKAAIRIIQAIQRKEKILVFGDYDVDGQTATTILFLGLKRFGANVCTRVPLRKEGYGITPDAIEKYARDVSLIITVDNGSSAHDAMSAARSRGIDVIVTDHHEITGDHPSCFAFINPLRSDNTYPFDKLCGVGIAFKVLHALYKVTEIPWNHRFWNFIELAALGTIADMVPLRDENRVISSLGLQRLVVKK